MVDTIRQLPALQSLLADNTTGDISPQDVRDALVSIMPPPPQFCWVKPMVPTPTGLTGVALSPTVMRIGLFEVPFTLQADKWQYWINVAGTSQGGPGLYAPTAQYT